MMSDVKYQDYTDGEILMAIAERNEAAMEVLFNRYKLRLNIYIRRFVYDEGLVADLTNEVFIQVWLKAGTYEGRAAVSTWILTIARNKALSSLRRKKEIVLSAFEKQGEEGPHNPLIDNRADEADTPDISTLKHDKAQSLYNCVVQLSSLHREVIELVYYQEQSIREVSQITDVPVNTVKTRLHHARRNLSELMKHEGIDRGWP